MKTNSNLNVLIMAGGQGTRFWPESTKSKPKQYLSLTSSSSLLSDTLKRFKNFIPIKNRYIVSVKAQKSNLVSSLIGEAHESNLIYEPEGRNTAPCILLSLASLLEKGAKADDICLVVPADHVILNTSGFQDTVKVAIEEAKINDSIVTIGIKPTFPHTGYGYIHKSSGEDDVYNVSSFKEKPDFETAKDYLRTGEYLWNAGMFLGKISVFLKEFELHAPEIYSYFKSICNSLQSPKDLNKIYSQIPEDSIDYAIMEKSKVVKVVEAKFDWNDLGSWDALESVIKPVDENIFVKEIGHYLSNSKDNIIFAPKQFVSLIDVNNLIVVSNEKNLMILPKDKAQEVKNIVKHLKENEPDLKLL